VKPITNPVAEMGALKVTDKKQTDPKSKMLGWLSTPRIMPKRAAPAIPKAKDGVSVPP